MVWAVAVGIPVLAAHQYDAVCAGPLLPPAPGGSGGGGCDRLDLELELAHPLDAPALLEGAALGRAIPVPRIAGGTG